MQGDFSLTKSLAMAAEGGLREGFCKSLIVLALGCVGPLALPLIWWRPQTTRAWKIGLTIGILIASWLLALSTIRAIHTLKQYYQMMNGF